MLRFEESGFSAKEWKQLKKLSSPAKIQDYLSALPFNFEEEGETHTSVKETLRTKTAHCFEGALVAAAALWIQGRRPLLLDLKVVRPDFDHIVTLFEEEGKWGAISKTNHAVLRYREPVYASVRELAMSYFHEYFLQNGKKTMRSFSKPFDLSKHGTDWLTSPENLADLAHVIDQSPHTEILSPQMIRKLRKAEKIEIKAAGLAQFSGE
jgi:hypothetical protein